MDEVLKEWKRRGDYLIQAVRTDQDEYHYKVVAPDGRYMYKDSWREANELVKVAATVGLAINDNGKGYHIPDRDFY